MASFGLRVRCRFVDNPVEQLLEANTMVLSHNAMSDTCSCLDCSWIMRKTGSWNPLARLQAAILRFVSDNGLKVAFPERTPRGTSGRLVGHSDIAGTGFRCDRSCPVALRFAIDGGLPTASEVGSRKNRAFVYSQLARSKRSPSRLPLPA